MERHETARAKEAFADFLALGSTRSLKLLLALYQSRAANGQPVPSLKHHTLHSWQDKHDWQERARQYGDEQIRAVLEAEQRQRERLLTEGIALKAERMSHLQNICDELAKDFANASIRWMRRNGTLVNHYRGVLDDAAREMGQRTPPAVQALMQMLEDERTGVARIVREELGDHPDAAARVAARLVALIESWGVQHQGGPGLLRAASGDPGGAATNGDAETDESGDESRF